MSTIQVVESKNTSGVLVGANYNVNTANPTIAMRHEKDDNGRDSLILNDDNINYTPLPVSIGTTAEKVLLLTYNGRDNNTNNLVETQVLLEQGNGPWIYRPSQFGPQLTAFDGNTYSPFDTPIHYDEFRGLTLTKEFLTSEANISDFYSIRISAPTLTYYPPVNVYENRVMLDGWYTSYIVVVRKYVQGDTYTVGQIVEYNGSLYRSLNGTDSLPTTTTDWSSDIPLENWISFLRENQEDTNSSKGFYGETQHLVTVDLNDNIIQELMDVAQEVSDAQFNITNTAAWVMLTQRRVGAYIHFTNSSFREVVVLIESAREYIYKLNKYEL